MTPLVLLHGVGADGRMFAPVTERLADSARSIVWNLPGYGGRPLDGPLTFPGLAGALSTDLDALLSPQMGATPAVVLGHSIGGMLALELAATFPERVRALILSAMTPAFGSRDGAFQREFLKARLAPLDAGRTMAELAPEFAPKLVGSGAAPEAAPTAAGLMAALPEATFRAGLACLVTFDRRADLASIAVPTLLIAGEEDANAPLKTMTRMAEAIPGARLEVLPRTGHLAPLECPDRFADIVRSFLAELPGDPVMSLPDLDQIDIDAAMFDAAAFGIGEEEAGLNTLARRLGKARFGPRAAEYDRDARFPTENCRDMRDAGLLGIAVPKEHGGLGAGYRAYMTTAAEIGRYCGATALTYNMHVCSCLWSGPLADDLTMSEADRADHNRRRAIHYARIVKDGAIYAQPFSEGGAAAAGAAPFSTSARRVDGGWRIDGKKIFASLSGSADYYGILCGETKPGQPPSRRDTMYIAVPGKAEGVEVVGDWDPLGMRGTVSRTLLLKDVLVGDDAALMPRGVYYQAASRWPHMFMTLTPTYMGIAQAAFDFTVKYLRGEIPGTGPEKRRKFPTKQVAIAQMFLMLQQTKALWLQAISEARADPTKEQVLRAYAAQHTVMENSNALAQLAIRTCGGQSMLKTLPLERLYRDSRCGSLMLPWTAEICLDRIGREALYEPGETDE